MEASPEVICWSNSMQWLLSHITLPNKPTLNECSLHHISKVYHLDASPSTNYILNDVQVLCWTQGCSWSATASELSGARWIISHLNLFPQLSWYPWKKKRVMMKIQTRPSKLCKSRYNLPKNFWCLMLFGCWWRFLDSFDNSLTGSVTGLLQSFPSNHMP